ncbi:hypothetical protein LG943_10515 [Streptomonospora sp. S1-112]|uniref:Uncharacterized protein n=1 Tax=Streptomonospora mangrovi TaxID=2883123 RepID=A0A9X3NJ86_9ACTN|nr:hypothetical protein [Streptomonospora mangrovi]MDA0564757.1 hypothetical protein [Streptomonospora mangrovi]
MAGTLAYNLGVRHIFQRKFDSPELAKALKDCHWYLISRRPSVRIVNNSAQIYDNILTAVFEIRTEEERTEHRELGMDLNTIGEARDLKIHTDGSYFSLRTKEAIYHGDAWALASFLSGADAGLATQEVMYVGQAFKGGTSNAWDRTSKHKKLQRIYEDHSGLSWDIFVSPLVLNKRTWSSDDHLDDTDDGPSMRLYYEKFAHENGDIRQASVDLIEHSMINYFKPPYNEKLIGWSPETPTASMRDMRAAGFRLLYVHLDGWFGLSRFVSEARPDAVRSHFITHELISQSDASKTLKQWTLEGVAYREGHKIFATEVEDADVHLRVFGEEAPEVRRPPSFHFPRGSSLNTGTKSTPALAGLSDIRRKIQEQRESEKIESQVPVQPTYEPHSGTVKVGWYTDTKEPSFWRLNFPTGGVCSGLILGGDGSGKTNTLRVIMTETLKSGVFVIAPAFPRSPTSEIDGLRSFTPDPSWVSHNKKQTIFNLERMARVIDARNAHKGYSVPSKTAPGIMIFIDDSDEILSDPLGAEIAEKILVSGSLAGVGLVPVVRDIDSLPCHKSLIRLLINTENVLNFFWDDPFLVHSLRAIHGKPRRRTYTPSSNLTFMLDNHPDCISVGILCGVANSPSMPKKEALRWAETELSQSGARLVGWTKQHGAWVTFDALSATIWQLRRHPDDWVISHVLSQHGLREPVRLSHAIAWASNIIHSKFDVQIGQWNCGPGTLPQFSSTLYTNTTGEIILKKQTGKLSALMRHLY